MAKDNFNEEAEFVKKHAEKIEKVSPKIYKELKDHPPLG